MESVNIIIRRYEDIYPLPHPDIVEYLKKIPREICIGYGLLMSNYTQEDDIYTQITKLGFIRYIPTDLLDLLTRGCLPNNGGDFHSLFTSKTGLEILKYTFSIPEYEFHKKDGQRFSLTPLITAILIANSDLVDKGAHFGDTSQILFKKKIKSHKYEQDDRINAYSAVYRMFSLLHFFEQNTTGQWADLKSKLLEDLGFGTLRDYIYNISTIFKECTLEPKRSNTIFRLNPKDKLYKLIKQLTIDINATIALEDNRDYTAFKERPFVQSGKDQYAVISNGFVANQLYSSLKFRMSAICDTYKMFDFFQAFNTDFIEKYLLFQIFNYALQGKGLYLTEDDCKRVHMEIIQNKQRKFSKSEKEELKHRLPDGYFRCGNKILLIECKGKTMKKDVYEDEEKCIKDINTDLVSEKKGTGQLLYNCSRILDVRFLADKNIPSDFKIYPLLIVDDFSLSSPGFNRYIIEQTKDSVESLTPHVNPITVLDMDTLILIAELIRTEQFDIFNNIEEYHAYIEGNAPKYSVNELFNYSEASFSMYIYDKYETCSPKIIDDWFMELQS